MQNANPQLKPTQIIQEYKGQQGRLVSLQLLLLEAPTKQSCVTEFLIGALFLFSLLLIYAATA